uniref:Uncharacterized protein n=1 Tax=Chromera velia CCMP2878 TaxID=1169474 RepID=A0A0K6S9J9_9ALVE|eukprot:Cvel_30627.t2-p1 / transcript=Cvel_30627.t2 / gene=Cvel_30627 / organism=Chromera_velia_CCMP2878 / gene_product=hypothetical protein / transcript_product=hypothetical protein / location=Cvel_scaffold4401:5576-8533(-) / protein_length=986 / sequence_SO=supercontig / SO=protein_coding / is_pseudo=false
MRRRFAKFFFASFFGLLLLFYFPLLLNVHFKANEDFDGQTAKLAAPSTVAADGSSQSVATRPLSDKSLNSLSSGSETSSVSTSKDGWTDASRSPQLSSKTFVSPPNPEIHPPPVQPVVQHRENGGRPSPPSPQQSFKKEDQRPSQAADGPQPPPLVFEGVAQQGGGQKVSAESDPERRNEGVKEEGRLPASLPELSPGPQMQIEVNKDGQNSKDPVETVKEEGGGMPEPPVRYCNMSGLVGLLNTDARRLLEPYPDFSWGAFSDLLEAMVPWVLGEVPPPSPLSSQEGEAESWDVGRESLYEGSEVDCENEDYKAVFTGRRREKPMLVVDMYKHAWDLQLLEMRLEEQWEGTDLFFLYEYPLTLMGLQRPRILKRALELPRFRKFWSKVIVFEEPMEGQTKALAGALSGNNVNWTVVAAIDHQMVDAFSRFLSVGEGQQQPAERGGESVPAWLQIPGLTVFSEEAVKAASEFRRSYWHWKRNGGGKRDAPRGGALGKEGKGKGGKPTESKSAARRQLSRPRVGVASGGEEGEEPADPEAGVGVQTETESAPETGREAVGGARQEQVVETATSVLEARVQEKGRQGEEGLQGVPEEEEKRGEEAKPPSVEPNESGREKTERSEKAGIVSDEKSTETGGSPSPSKEVAETGVPVPEVEEVETAQKSTESEERRVMGEVEAETNNGEAVEGKREERQTTEKEKRADRVEESPSRLSSFAKEKVSASASNAEVPTAQVIEGVAMITGDGDEIIRGRALKSLRMCEMKASASWPLSTPSVIFKGSFAWPKQTLGDGACILRSSGGRRRGAFGLADFVWKLGPRIFPVDDVIKAGYTLRNKGGDFCANHLGLNSGVHLSDPSEPSQMIFRLAAKVAYGIVPLDEELFRSIQKGVVTEELLFRTVVIPWCAKAKHISAFSPAEREQLEDAMPRAVLRDPQRFCFISHSASLENVGVTALSKEADYRSKMCSEQAKKEGLTGARYKSNLKRIGT